MKRTDDAKNQVPRPVGPIKRKENSLNARKTITFGDASSVTGSPFMGICSVISLGILWYLSSFYVWVSPIFWPSPAEVWAAFISVSTEGFRNHTLLQHVGWSMYRIFMGFGIGCVVGIPVGMAMGLSNTARGLLDPFVEFFRPIPPLGFIPLMIIWFGIGERSKILLLVFAAVWIMILAARAGVSGIKLSKIHAAYTLGASKYQVLTRVIFPNALPEIFTGMRMAMGVCWGTVVAAELVAGDKGVGFLIMSASTFLSTDIVVMGIIIIGIIGYTLDMIMRKLEAYMIPWEGKG